MSKGKAVLKLGGYAAFAFACFVISLYATFPTQALKQFAALKAESFFKGDVVVKAGELSLAGLSGVRLEKVNLFFKQKGNEAPQRMSFDFIEVRVHVLSTLGKFLGGDGDDDEPEVEKKKGTKKRRSRTRVTKRMKTKKSMLGPLGGLDFELGKGRANASGTLSETDGTLTAEVGLSKWNLNLLPQVKDAMPIPFHGVVSAKLDLELPANWQRSGSGNINVSMQGAAAGPGKLKTPMGNLTLPEIDVGTVTLQLKMDKGKVSITKWQQSGRTLASSDISGKVQLKKPFGNSRLDLNLKLKFDDKAMQKEPKLATMLQLSGLQKDKDGMYTLPLQGTVNRPKPNISRKGGFKLR